MLLNLKNQLFTQGKTKSSSPQQGPLFKGQSILDHKCHLLVLQQEMENVTFCIERAYSPLIVLKGDDN